jgi:capsular polysaccharide biosynthesis protein
MLNPQQLKAAIKVALDAESDVNVDPAQARDRTAEAIANAIHAYISQATIIYVAGLTTPPGGGPVTGTFQGNLL